MASKRELQALIVLAGKVDPSLKKALLSAEKSTKGLNKTTQLLGKTASKTFDIIKKGAVLGVVGLGAAMVYVGKKGLDLASDLNEVQNVVDVTFGQNANQINSWSQTALKSYGLSELAAKQYSSTIGAMMKSSGISSKHLVSMSENLSGLAGDFASFYNLDPAEAFEKIRSGISGETEPLKQLGINMSVANLEAFALSKGIKTAYAKMGQADQTILRYNYLLEKSADAQGDFARTQDSYANQQRLFGESFKQLSANVMKAAIPAFTKLYEKGNQLIDKFASSPEKMQKLQDFIGKMADKIVEFIPKAVEFGEKFGGALMKVYNGAKDVYNFIHDNWKTIEPLLWGIVGAMVAWKAVTVLMAVYNQIMAAVKLYTLGAAAAHNVLSIAKWKDVAATTYLMALYAKDAIVKGVSVAATWAMTAATTAWTVATTIATAVGTAFAAVIAFITSPIGIVILAIAGLIAIGVLLYKNWDKVSAFLADSWTMVKRGFAVGVNYIVDKLNWLLEKMNKIPGVEIPLIPKMDTGAVQAATNSVGSARLKKFAVGGFANRPAIFGEAGPEAAIPLKRTPRSLSLLGKTAQALGVGSGGDSGSSGSSGVTFVYSPTYGSGTSESQVRKDFEEFKAMCEEWLESRRREQFA